MRLSHETLKAILVQVPPKEDRRNFFVRLLGSIRFTSKIKWRDDGKASVSIGVRGGTDL
jgi:hypothetical protein